jgi:hypothetical protein
MESSPHPTPAVCMDFDDTLCASDNQALAGARHAVATVRSWGYRVIVSSARFSPMYGELNSFRMRQVQGWLDSEGFEIDGLAYVVPSAVAYVDDRAQRFTGDWPALLEDLAKSGQLERDGVRISLGLECLLRDKVALPGAEQGLSSLRDAKVDLVASAGPAVADGDVDEILGQVREDLKAAGLWPLRVEAAKIASNLYVSSRACTFRACWKETLDELAVLLEES